MCEAEVDEETNKPTKIIRSHYFFRINQYIRTTSSLLLRLGMNLKRIHDLNFKLLDIHDSKVFKLLSECFTRQRES